MGNSNSLSSVLPHSSRRYLRSFSMKLLFCGVLFFLATTVVPRGASAKTSSQTAAPRLAKNQKTKAALASAQARNNAKRAQNRKSSTQSRNLGWLRSHPQIALFAGALGTLALAAGLVAISRPKQRPREEATTPQLRHADEGECLHLLLDFERAARKENEVLFWKMALHANDALHIFYPGEGTVQWFGVVDNLLGYAQNSFPRTVDAWTSNVHPDDKARVIDAYQTACKGGDFKIEYRMRHRNGSYKEWAHRARPTFDERRNLVSLVGACSDVTERNRARRELKGSEEKFVSVLEANPVAFLMCDVGGNIVVANRAAERLFGCKEGGLGGKTYGDGSWKIVNRNGARVSESQMPHALLVQSNAPLDGVQHTIERADGESVHVLLNGAPLRDEKENVNGSIVFLSDVTERVESELRSQREAFYDALNGLANHALFCNRLQHSLCLASHAGTSVALLLLDDKCWKRVGDALGEGAGDDLLKITAQRLNGSIRNFDTVARLHSGEFAVLLEDIASVAKAQVVIDRVLDALQKPISLRGREIVEAPHLGAALSDALSAPDVLMSRAEEALKLAQNQRNTLYLWHEASLAPVESEVAAEKGQNAEATAEATMESSSYYFSTDVVSDEVSTEGIVNGILESGLAVHRVTSDGVLVAETTDAENAISLSGAANGHVIKSQAAREEPNSAAETSGKPTENSSPTEAEAAALETTKTKLRLLKRA